MKTFISLLIVLAITEFSLPTVTAAVIPYDEQEINTINMDYLEENNLELLNRDKRQIMTPKSKKVAILEKDSTGSRKAGDIYIGTTKGVYLKYVGTHKLKKIEGINEPVATINIDYDGAAFVTTSSGKLFYINHNGNNQQGVQSYIPDKILSIGILKEDSSDTRRAGDLYIGTTEGVYLKYVGTHKVEKISGIDDPVIAINIDFNGGAFVTTSIGKLYYINPKGNNDQGVQSYIPDRILSVGVLKKDSSGLRKAGDIYIGTTEGVYLKYVGTHEIKKIQGINEPVTAINIDYDGGAFVTTSSGKLFYINHNGDNEQGVQNYIPHKVLSIGILQKDSTGRRKAGDLYIGTTEGVYLKFVGTHDIKKVNDINESVVAVNIDYDGGAFVTTSTGKFYYISHNGDNEQGVQDYIPDQIL